AVGVELCREVLRSDAFERVAVLLERHLGDDRQVAYVPDSEDGGADLGQVGERFQHEEIDAARQEGFRLPAENLARLLDRCRPPRLDPYAEGSDRSRDVLAAA